MFELPSTMKSRYEGNHPHPMFDDNIYTDVLGVNQNKTSSELLDYEKFSRFQHHMKQYYGMVKCIDDNLGNFMKFLTNLGLDDNTVVVFTSDHGE